MAKNAKHYRQTFQVTKKRRSWYQRMTVFGWLALGVVGALLFLALVLASRGAANWWQGRQWGREEATPEPVAAVATQSVIPTSTPEITATAAISVVWWVEQMTPDGNGGYLLPEEARAELEADYLEVMAHWEKHRGVPWRLEEEVDGQSVTDLYTTGEMRTHWLGWLERLQDGSLPSPDIATVHKTHLVQVQGCTVDGLACDLGDMMREATIFTYDAVNRVILNEKPAEAGYDGTMVYKMVYDLEDERWKLAEHLMWLPAPPSGGG